MRIILFCIVTLLSFDATAQLNDNFNDGDFSQQPKWSGIDSVWMINTQNQLQTNSNTINSNYYLSTVNTKATIAQWEFWIKVSFNPSSANYVDVFLTASDSNLLKTNITGYYVKIGNTDDEVSLYRKDNGASIKIIDGINGTLNQSESILKIKVTRDENNMWELFRQQNSASFISEGVVCDSTYLSSAYFGCVVKQSTASFFQKHYFDEFLISDYVRDTIPPKIDSVIAFSKSKIDIQFNESVDKTTAEHSLNYFIDNGIGYPTAAVLDPLNHSLVHLTFSDNIFTRTILRIHIEHIKDVKENEMSQQEKSFIYYTAAPYDIIIEELMPDPSPSNGLPETEWIEIKNISPFDIDLAGWKIGKASELSGSMSKYILKRDSFLVVASTSSVNALAQYTNVMGVPNFPSLTNTNDLIYLLSPEEKTIHAVEYSDEWYINELKRQGGWSIEMMDVNSPCIGAENWSASKSILGASPGKINSIDAINIDEISPQLVRAFALDSLHIKLYFNEPLDSEMASNVLRYSISDQIGTPLIADPIPPLFSEVNLTLISPLSRNKKYEVYAKGIKDCIGNEIGLSNHVFAGLVEKLESKNIVVNEILFNPKPNGYDYIEVYNRSNKILDLKNLFLANLNAQNSIDNITAVQKSNYAFFPGDYFVFTESKAMLSQLYFTNNPTAIFQVANMPSYGDDEGNVILLNNEGDIIDKVSYNKEWQFKLIDNLEGISLERLNVEGPSQDEHNWHSASSTAGYGTPAYKNSQTILVNSISGEITISPNIISPNNDGVNDNATIYYSFAEPGNVCSILIFDDAGRPVKKIVENLLCGTSGYIVWDGLNDKNQPMGKGAYIVYLELFNLKGNTNKIKKVIYIN